ncbi:MAG TPA: hypothetical protein VGI63_09540 [Verrucomicrobiae bacterium]|jgi:VIT1/CCC1 family predicted Fe2+/Mn2+ transporter
MSDTSQQTVNTEQRDVQKAEAVSNSVPTTGRRQVFKNLQKELSDEELKSPGITKLILEMLASAEAERDEFKLFVEKFHAADKNAAVLGEQLKTNKINEILFGVGVGLGGAIVGLAPLFWGTDSKGPVVLALGIAMIIGSTIGRIVYK